MIIDFEKISETHITNFKGGQGHLDTRNYTDDKIKIMYSSPRCLNGMACTREQQ